MGAFAQLLDLAEDVTGALENFGAARGTRRGAPRKGRRAAALSASRDEGVGPTPRRATDRTREQARGQTLNEPIPPGGAFRIEEVVDAATGALAWIVTDGRDRAECRSMEFARRVRDALVR